jgi:hypothetical protein
MRRESEKDDDDIVSDFEIKLNKISDKMYQLESCGTSKSIVNILEGFLEKLKGKEKEQKEGGATTTSSSNSSSSVNLPSDYCMGSISLTDNLGPVSMPIYLNGNINILLFVHPPHPPLLFHLVFKI